MKGFFTRLVITSLGLWLASKIVPGIAFSGWGTLILAALLLGLVNAIVRPILFILTLPITLLTLGCSSSSSTASRSPSSPGCCAG